MSDLTKRLRGIYEIPVNDGAGPLDGKNTFTRTFDNMPPICIEAADRIDALEECLRELVADITDSEHSPHDWSEQVVVKQARALLGEK